MRWRFTVQQATSQPGRPTQPSAMRRAPNAPERSRVPCDMRLMKPVLCAVPVGACGSCPLYHMHSTCLFINAILSSTFLLSDLFIGRTLDRLSVLLISSLDFSKHHSISHYSHFSISRIRLLIRRVTCASYIRTWPLHSTALSSFG